MRSLAIFHVMVFILFLIMKCLSSKISEGSSFL